MKRLKDMDAQGVDVQAVITWTERPLSARRDVPLHGHASRLDIAAFSATPERW